MCLGANLIASRRRAYTDRIAHLAPARMERRRGRGTSQGENRSGPADAQRERGLRPRSQVSHQPRVLRGALHKPLRHKELWLQHPQEARPKEPARDLLRSLELLVQSGLLFLALDGGLDLASVGECHASDGETAAVVDLDGESAVD